MDQNIKWINRVDNRWKEIKNRKTEEYKNQRMN